MVPSQAVQIGPVGSFVFTIGAESIAELRPVQVGRIEDGLALIDSGLAPGERVVIDGQYRLQPGSKVRSGEGKKGPANAQAQAGAANAPAVRVASPSVETGQSKARP